MNKPDIQELTDDGNHLCGYFAKGEFNEQQMIDQIRWQFDDEFQMSKYCSIETRVYRWIPEPPTSDMPFNRRLEPSRPGRGAFVATVIYFI